MSKYRLTTLSPVHISSGEEYELNYNLLEKDGFVYFYDEFKLVEFFIAHDISIPLNMNELKRVISDKKDDIIASNLHVRKVQSSFSKVNKPVLSQISTAEFPIITGSSIKGSLRTAILDCIYNETIKCQAIVNLMKNKNMTEERLSKKGRVPFDRDFAEIFKYLRVTDSLVPLKTQIYKTINIKSDKSHQSNREKKIEDIANFVEAVKPKQSFEIELNDTHEEQIFKNLSWMCNKFYIPFFANNEKHYFSKKIDLAQISKNADKNMFIINVGRFGGAQSKSLNNIRYIRASKAVDKSTTTARTFALEQSSDESIYFENRLLPFGWLMCEKIYDNTSDTAQQKNNFDNLKKEKYQAIDKLNEIKRKKAEYAKQKDLQKIKEQEQARIEKEKQKAELEEKLAKMSPVEKIIDSYESMALLINDMKSGEIENFEEMKIELAGKIRDEMIKNPKEWEKAKQKALKRKEYILSILAEK